MGMSTGLGKIRKRLNRWQQEHAGTTKVWITAASVASCIIILRALALLQPLEWAALDQFFRLRPQEAAEQRITLVTIDEASLRTIGKWPFPDAVFAEVLQKINVHQPRAIGLDIYRDLPVAPGYAQLLQAYKSIPNLIGIEKLADANSHYVSPPPVSPQQIGFNNVIVDSDGKVRRSLLYWNNAQHTHESFALKLATIYLAAAGITPQPAKNHPEYLQLGHAVFRSFQPNDGGYVQADAGGYQILANFRRPGGFAQVSIVDVLEDRVPENLLKSRIVLIGSTAPSLKDFFATPYNDIAGVELHANFISQILSTALSKRPLIHVCSELCEALWILAWAIVGAHISWYVRSPKWSVLSILVACGILTSSAYVAFLSGWWFPVVPALLSIGGGAIVITSHIAYLQYELQRSKEFLQGVINTIPDPIFVKNQKHQWIVLNEAFCQFMGYPLEILLGKSDYDFLPQHEADIFWEQDELVFIKGSSSEIEEKLTNRQGITHLIATKKSLHKDSAGNLFLVGVIRDITERKRVENELKRTAAELLRSNTELQLSQDRLRYLAYHDPLTGLPNRKLFYDHLDQSLAWAHTNKLLLGLLFIDLDGFKQVNDTLGHDNGDRLLVSVAQRLQQCLRASDIVSRLGGDEFTVLLPGIPKPQVVATVCDKILATLAAEFHLEGQNIYITASIGISVYPLNGDCRDTLVKQADRAMYQAKQQGKNCYVFASLSNILH